MSWPLWQTQLKENMNNKILALSSIVLVAVAISLSGCNDRPVQVIQPAPQVVQQAPQVIGYDSAGQPVYGNPQVVQQAAYPGQPTVIVQHDNGMNGFVAGAVVGSLLSNNNGGYRGGDSRTTVVNKTVVVNNHVAPVATVPTPVRPNYAAVATPVAPKPATTSMFIPAPKPVATAAPSRPSTTSSFSTSRPSTPSTSSFSRHK